MKFWLHNLPIPHTQNHAMVPVRGRLIKSSDARFYDATMNLYEARHSRVIEGIRGSLVPHMEKHTLNVEVFIVFHESRVFTKGSKAKDRLKAIDSTNRIKALLDHVAKWLSIDDRYQFHVTVEKLTCTRQDEEQVIVSLSLGKPRTLEDLEDQIDASQLRHA